MKKFLTTLLILAVSGAGAFAMSYNEAKSGTKPIVVLLKMKQCSACRKFEPIFDQEAAKYSDKYNFVKEDVYSSSLGTKLNVQSVPALFIIEPKTEATRRIDNGDMWDTKNLENILKNYK